MVFCQPTPSPTPSDISSQAFNVAQSMHGTSQHPSRADKSNQEDDTSSHVLISNALQSLSLEERDQIFDDIHGVDKTAEDAVALETPEFLDNQLQSFQEELQRIKAHHPTSPEFQALHLAEHQDKDFVSRSFLRLAFLRTRQWDTQEAVAAFVRYFDLKQYLFGKEKLTKQITVSDLAPLEQTAVYKGYFQVLPYRDRSGRAVVVWLNVGQEYASADSLARQLFIMHPLDVETQRRGATVLSLRVEPFRFERTPTLQNTQKLNRFLYDMPLRLASHHICLPPSNSIASSFRKVLDAFVSAYTPKLRVRLRIHYGTFMEWCYELMTFGIPVHLLPLTADYKVKTKNHREYLDMQIQANIMGDRLEPGSTLLPTNWDLLIGKGKPIQQAPGNIRWSEFLEALASKPILAGSMLYTDLAKQVVQHVRSSGGQILSKESGVWAPVSDAVAQDKVLNMMRHKRFRRRHQGSSSTKTL